MQSSSIYTETLSQKTTAVKYTYVDAIKISLSPTHSRRYDDKVPGLSLDFYSHLSQRMTFSYCRTYIVSLKFDLLHRYADVRLAKTQLRPFHLYGGHALSGDRVDVQLRRLRYYEKHNDKQSGFSYTSFMYSTAHNHEAISLTLECHSERPGYTRRRDGREGIVFLSSSDEVFCVTYVVMLCSKGPQVQCSHRAMPHVAPRIPTCHAGYPIESYITTTMEGLLLLVCGIPSYKLLLGVV